MNTLRMRYPTAWFVTGLGVGTVTLLFFAVGCGHPGTNAQSPYSAYLGSDACAPCHTAEFQKHRDSRHATTLRRVDAASLGRDLPIPGDIPDTNFVLKPAGTGFVLAVKDQPELQQPLQYALGSGKFALTYIHIQDKDSVIELRESYYPPQRAWKYTPGQAHIEGDGLGRMYTGVQARACVTCHTTTISPNDITPDRRFYGVGCESCHGPGKEHVAAVNATNQSDLHMPKLGLLGAARINERCGRCHRSAKDVPPGDTSTQRFQPYGLMKSRCFLDSGDKLSCQTCHDPHSNVSTDKKQYEKVCLGCHVPGATTPPGPGTTRGKICPVNNRTGCIPCHMPVREVTPDAPISMADHYIRVNQSEASQDRASHEFNSVGPLGQ